MTTMDVAGMGNRIGGPGSLAGKRAIVIGASSGIGLATAETLLAEEETVTDRHVEAAVPELPLDRERLLRHDRGEVELKAVVARYIGEPVRR